MPFQFQFNPRYRFVVNCTTRCNFNCPHCLRQTLDEKKTLRLDLPVSLFKQCLKEFKKINYRYVAFTGGEPILHPDFGRLVAAAVKENFSFSVINNGWFYRDYFPILDKYRLQLTRMSFSLDGSMAAIHDRIRNKSGSYDKVMEGIEFYKNKGFRVWVTSCFNQLNLSDFWNIHKLLDFFKVDDWFILGIDDILSCQDYQPDFYRLTDRDRRQLRQEILKLWAKHLESGSGPRLHSSVSFGPSNPKIDFCRIFRYFEPAIHPDGTMTFCCNIYKECARRPSIEKDGFWPSFNMTLKSIEKLKVQRLKDVSEKNFFDGFNTCNYCNKYIEEILQNLKNNG